MYIIIPSCSDLNRGDQALVWEAVRITKECGFDGEYYFMSERNEPIKQSLNKGLKVIKPILEHPSRKFKNKNNLVYTKSLKLKWGTVAFFDLIISILLLSKITRWIALPIMKGQVKESFRLFKKADAIFVKGGGFIHAYGGLTSTYYIYFSLFHIFLGHALNKPVYIFPNSIGPFNGPLVKTLVKNALKKCKVIFTREAISQKMIKNDLGLSVENMPDLAFYLPNGKLSKNDFFARHNLPSNKKLVAMTMRPHRFPNSKTPEQDYTNFVKSIASFANWLYSNGYMPVLVEHVLAVNYNENDGECIKEVCQYLNEGEYRLVSDKECDCHDLKKIYSFFDYIVGTRFHSMIFSMANGVPGFAITYTGNKGQGIMNEMDLQDYYISIEDVTFDLLRDKFLLVKEREDIVKEKISKYLKYANTQRNRIKSIIKYSCEKN